MVDWWVSLQVKEEVVVEAHFSGFLLDKDEKHNYNTHTHTHKVAGKNRGDKLELLVHSQDQLWRKC